MENRLAPSYVCVYVCICIVYIVILEHWSGWTVVKDCSCCCLLLLLLFIVVVVVYCCCCLWYQVYLLLIVELLRTKQPILLL